MKIIIETIPHSEQRYPTVGDWQLSTSDSTIINAELRIRVSSMGDWRKEALVGIHEAVEAILCADRQITGGMVDEFDMQYEKDRPLGNDDEPGDDPRAPYRKEHFFATSVERLLAAELGVDWMDYERTVNNL